MNRDLYENHRLRREICDWLRANGIDPARTPADSRLSIADGQITLLQKVQRDGRDVIDETGYDVLKETVTIPLLIAPEGDVAIWVEPKCPTCGR